MQTYTYRLNSPNRASFTKTGPERPRFIIDWTNAPAAGDTITTVETRATDSAGNDVTANCVAGTPTVVGLRTIVAMGTCGSAGAPATNNQRFRVTTTILTNRFQNFSFDTFIYVRDPIPYGPVPGANLARLTTDADSVARSRAKHPNVIAVGVPTAVSAPVETPPLAAPIVVPPAAVKEEEDMTEELRAALSAMENTNRAAMDAMAKEFRDSISGIHAAVVVIQAQIEDIASQTKTPPASPAPDPILSEIKVQLATVALQQEDIVNRTQNLPEQPADQNTLSVIAARLNDLQERLDSVHGLFTLPSKKKK